MEKVIFHQGADDLIRNVVGREEALQLMKEFHKGVVCGRHFVRKLIVFKIFDVGYYWKNIFKDCVKFCRSYDVCQAFAKKSMKITLLISIPMLDLLNLTPRENKFTVIVIDYLTNWIESRSLKSTNEK